MMTRAPLAALALLVTAAPAHAAPAGAAPAGDRVTWAAPLAGRWTLSGVSEGDPVCAVTLGQDMAIGGASITLSATCRRNYPLEDVAGWTLGKGKALVLIDPLRKPVVTFETAGDGSYMATFSHDRKVSLDRGPPDAPASVRDLFEEGTFTLSGPDNAAPCGFAVTTLSATRGELEQAGRCAAPWKGRGWASWSFANGQLQLKDAKGVAILTLRRADEYTFVAEQPSGPIFFGPGYIDGSEMLEGK